MSFVLPGCRSSFSLLWGTASPEEIIKAGEKAGVRHLGLADNDNLYGAIDFYYGCREAGINPLIGTRLTTALGELHLIAQSFAGYQNLCRLVTKRQLEDDVNTDDLARHSDDLVCLVSPEIAIAPLKEVFASNLFLSVQGHEYRDAETAKKQFGVRPVANPRMSFLNKDDYGIHSMLRAIDTGALVANLNGTPRDTSEAFFPDIKTIRQRYRLMPEAISNGLELADSCRLKFPEQKTILPDYPNHNIDKAGELRQKALDGLHRKKGCIKGKYLSRLDFELSIINRTGFTDYFLIVSGIVDHCRKTGIPVVGRGSAAGSLVAYSLFITEVDPIKEGLYFERFLNEARSDPPDIDLDIDWRRRDDVLDYIYNTFGHDRTAMIASYIRFRSRLAVREVAKASGVSPDEIDRIVKELPRFGMDKMTQGTGKTISEYSDIFTQAARLDELPRHLGIHPGGIVITPKPLTDYVALERSTKGIVITQCDMYQAEKLGLVKIDILGQRGLAVIVDCREHAHNIESDTFNIPDNDIKTQQLLQSGKTIGVFQIESPGLRSLLRDIKPTELNDITLALSLIRPGASDSGMKKVFLDRHHGREVTKYPDDRLADILKETHGVFIYQEQVLLCARAIAGFNLPAADMLRRAITKGRKNKYEQLHNRFLDGAIKNGLSVRKAGHILKLLRNFAGFGFCKAHAATYAYLAYQSAYYKAHYPARFMQAVLNNDGGYYPSFVYINEARRMGVKILPPDINKSEKYETVFDSKMYVGLSRIKNLERNSIRQILDSRPFDSFDDFLSKVRLSASEVEALIKTGAFDSLVDNRPRLLWRLRLRRGKRQPVGAALTIKGAAEDDIFAGQLIVPEAKQLPELPDSTPFEIFQYERHYLGFSASVHPLELFPNYDGRTWATIRESHTEGGFVIMHAWLADRKTIKTRESKQSMVFLTFEDMYDTFEVVLFPEMYKRYYQMIRRFKYLRIEGTLNRDGGNLAIIAEKLSPAPTGLFEHEFI
ncbi:MAG: DNA polymerase III subunit alpha [candidate division Zixibacteria bacterium]|nr:DNA polymerase III subunit alpha [candidate division Zixibacteria bacterium]